MRRLAHPVLVLLVVATLAGAMIGAVHVDPATAQTTTTSPTTAPPTLPEIPDGAGSIIGPKPGQGVAPDDAGDRGGAGQIALFFVLVGALGGGALLVRRDIAKNRAARAMDR